MLGSNLEIFSTFVMKEFFIVTEFVEIDIHVSLSTSWFRLVFTCIVSSHYPDDTKMGYPSFVIETSSFLKLHVPPFSPNCLTCSVNCFVTCLTTMASGTTATTSWKFPELTPFLFLSFSVSLFSSLSLPFASCFPFFLPFSPYYVSPSPLSSPVLRFRRYSSKSGTPHVLELLGNLDDFGQSSDTLFHYLFLVITFFFTGDYKKS